MISTSNSALGDEVEAINAIFGDGTIIITSDSDTHTSALVTFPGYHDRFQVRFPAQYPERTPLLLDIDSLTSSLDRKTRQDVIYMRALLFTLHIEGLVCLFDFIEEAQDFTGTIAINDSGSNKALQVFQPSKDLAQMAYDKCFEDEIKNEAEVLNSIVICAACMEPCFKIDAANLFCKHSFCIDCLRQGLRMMLDEGNDIRCCGRFIPISIVRSLGNFSDEELIAYGHWTNEFPNKSRLYCYDKQCNAAIPLPMIRGETARCPECERSICVNCGRFAHTGACPTDHKLQALIKKENLQACPGCGYLTDKDGGCRHMTCHCHTLWCWECGKIRFRARTLTGCKCDG